MLKQKLINMRTTKIKSRQGYSYKPLARHLENRATPLETARHIGRLLHALAYHADREGREEGSFRAYTEMYDLKTALENMEGNKKR